MENLSTLVNLTVLDVGDNKIRKIEGIDTLVNLEEFHAAKNKLTVIEGLDKLTNLILIAVQVNFISKITGLENLVELEQLYMQQNQIKKIEGLDNNPNIETLDIAVNKVSKFENLEHLTNLRELWMNWNNIEDSDENKEYLTKLTKLKTIYLADNPISMHESSEYQKMLTTAIPSLKQIDGNVLRMGRPFHHQRTEGIHPIVRKQVNPEAKKLLQEVLDSTTAGNTEGTLITRLEAQAQSAAASGEEEKKEEEKKEEDDGGQK